MRVLESHGKGAGWVVVPDIVGRGLESLAFSEAWLPRLEGSAPLLLAVQDGMVPADVAALVGSQLGIFLGGSTEWKVRTCGEWGRFAKATGAYFHVARVNTLERLRLAHRCGADSIDGSGPSRFALHAEKMSRWVREIDRDIQPNLFLGY